jgi:hypothetical protein
MMNSRHHLMLATALVTGLVVAAPLAIGQVRTPDSATVTTNPGFKPDTGQINPGVEHQAPSQSSQIISIPTPEESRAALMTPISTQPSAGAAPTSGPQGSGANASPPEHTASGLQPAATTGAATSEKAGAEPAATVGAGSSATPTAAGLPPPSGPIGATGQTMPAKFSSRNDILDRTPIMAWPQPLSDQQRQRIYQAVMADKSQPASDADRLAPAGELSTDQALNGMHSLPASLGDIAEVQRLKFVKGKSKVLLIEPSTRIVVEQITS